MRPLAVLAGLGLAVAGAPAHAEDAYRIDAGVTAGYRLVDIDGSKVKVTHSLTSMGCPAGPMIQEDIHRVASEVPSVEDVEIELTWDPPWTPEKMSDDAKFILGFG